MSLKSFTLIEVLQSLLQPLSTPIDPNEVSEIIKTWSAKFLGSQLPGQQSPLHLAGGQEQLS